MMQFTNTVTALILALLATNVRCASISGRQSNEEANLGSFYAYGEGIDGMPIFWSDETAFIGLEPPPEAAVATNVTFHDDSANTTLTVTANETDTLSATTFFIDNSAGAFEPAGFTTTASTGNDLITSGFIVFGNQLVLVDEGGSMEQLWWAVPTSTDGLWSLRWNVDTVTGEGAVPVVVKNVAPVSIGAGTS